MSRAISPFSSAISAIRQVNGMTALVLAPSTLVRTVVIDDR